MNINLYQINLTRDPEHKAFRGLDAIKGKVDWESYDKVFSGDVSCNDLEELCMMFNVDRPSGLAFRSMSVSDIVEVIDENESTKPGFYFCEPFGFKKIRINQD